MEFQHNKLELNRYNYTIINNKKIKLLNKLASLFNHLKVKYVIGHGNLVEYERNTPILHDDDIDLRVDINDTEKWFNYSNTLIKKGSKYYDTKYDLLFDDRAVDPEKQLYNGLQCMLNEEYKPYEIHADIVFNKVKTDFWMDYNIDYSRLRKIRYLLTDTYAPSVEDTKQVLTTQYNNYLIPDIKYKSDIITKNDLCIYYINLEQSKLKNEYMVYQLKKLNIDYNRFEAINITSPHKSLILSNLEIFKLFLEKHKQQYLLILEDDAIINDMQIQTIIDEINTNNSDFLMCDLRGRGCCANLYNKNILHKLINELNYESKIYKHYLDIKKAYLWDYIIKDYLIDINENKYNTNIVRLSDSGYFISEISLGSDKHLNKYSKFNNVNEYLKYVLNNCYIEGNLSSMKIKTNKLIDIIKTNNINNILEIGFNSGYSSEVMLNLNENINITSYDIGCHFYVKLAKYYIDLNFKGRHNLIIGDSNKTMLDNKDNRIYDLIFIDGGHTFSCALIDIINCYKFSNKDTLIIVDDVNKDNKEQKFVINPTNAVLNAYKCGIIHDLQFIKDGNNGMCIFRYVF